MINLLCSGLAPSVVIPHQCGAFLLAVKKKGGSLQPIAVGEVLRRLVSKCISRVVNREASDALSPLQVGVGVPLGCESVVHAMNSVQDDPHIPSGAKWSLLLDFSNAFNCVNREMMFEEVRARIPSIAAWMECCYGAQPLLHFGDHTILSCCGVQQGDPLGPLGFALALHPIVERINRELSTLLINVWYLDDGTLCGSAQDLLKALAIIEEEGPSRGLYLNRSKSVLFIPKDDVFSHNPLPCDIPVVREGYNLLGCPIGSPAYCASSVFRRVKKMQEIIAFCQPWTIHKWRLHSYVCVLLFLSSPFLSGPALLFTSGKPLLHLTSPCLKQFQIWWVVLYLTGPG